MVAKELPAKDWWGQWCSAALVCPRLCSAFPARFNTDAHGKEK